MRDAIMTTALKKGARKADALISGVIAEDRLNVTQIALAS